MQRISFPGPTGPLEALLEIPPAFSGDRAAVLCHPHPLYGGTMRNKVVARMAQTLTESGFAVLRFNFRGVERSTGTHDEGRGEVDDACAAVEYLTRTMSPRRLLLGGFSFGAWVAARSATGCRIDADLIALLSVGTPAALYGYGFLESFRPPILFVHGDADTVCDPAAVEPLARKPGQPRTLVVIRGADHFFTGRLRALQGAVSTYLHALLSPMERSSHA